MSTNQVKTQVWVTLVNRLRPSAIIFSIIMAFIVLALLWDVVAGHIGVAAFGDGAADAIVSAALIIVGAAVASLGSALSKLSDDPPPPTVPADVHATLIHVLHSKNLEGKTSGPQPAAPENGLVALVNRLRPSAIIFSLIMGFIVLVLLRDVVGGEIGHAAFGTGAADAIVSAALIIVGAAVSALGSALSKLSDDPPPPAVPADVHAALIEELKG